MASTSQQKLMPRQSEPCVFSAICPVFQVYSLISGAKPFAPDLLQLARDFQAYRQDELQKRIEGSEPWRSTIELLTYQNTELRAWKRRAEMFLLANGLELPPEPSS